MINFRKNGKIVLGLTGGISSGKSTAAAAFKKAGALVICADDLAAKYFNLKIKEIQKYFGTCDKAQIAAQIFTDAKKREWLEELLHPLILKEAQRIIKTAKKRVIVFDVPLLFEAGLQNGFDLVLCIYASFKTRQNRTPFARADFKKRDAAQIPLEAKAAAADIVIFSESAKKDLETKIKKLYRTVK